MLAPSPWTCYAEVIQPNIHLFKVNSRNTRKRCEICSKLTIKTPERRERELHQLIFASSNLAIEILEKRCEIYLKLTLKTPERRLFLLLT